MNSVKEMLTALAAADNKVATARAELQQAESEYEAIADRIMTKMDEEGMDKLTNKEVGLTAAINESEVFSFEDFEKFTQFMLRHKHPELLQRRLSAPAVRALIDQRGGTAIPGLGTYTKRKLSITKAR